MEFHIIGSGIAGLSAAFALAGKNSKVHIWEKENLPCMYSSSRNAAIFKTYEADPSVSLLVKESYRQLLEMEKTAGSMMDRRGVLIDPLELDYYENSFIESFPDLSEIKGRPETFDSGDGFSFKGIMLEKNGVMDIHAYQGFLIKSLTRNNTVFHFNRSIENLDIQQGRIVSIRDSHGSNTVIPEDAVIINAAGSWARDIISKTGAWSAPVSPYKRHLFFLRNGTRGRADEFPERSTSLAVPASAVKPESRDVVPVLWSERRDVYIRPEGDGFLATHCDQREVQAGDYASDEKEVDRFLKSVLSVFPFLKDHHISRYWACLRTFSLDQLPVIGFDPFIKNLFWVAGLGGRGITMSPGMIPLIRQLVYHLPDDAGFKKWNPFSPDRFL